MKDANLQLSKIIPAHTVTIQFYSVSIDWATMGPKWRSARSGLKSMLDSCFWCRHKFEDGEKMTLGFSTKGNKMLCRNCADSMQATQRSEE